MSVSAFEVSSTATIAAGGTKTNAIWFKDMAQAGFILPGTFTGATVSFEVSSDNITFAPFKDNTDTLVSLPVTQGAGYAFPIDLFPFPFVKIVSASIEGDARAIQIAAKY